MPTGIVESRQGRSRKANERDAMAAILATLDRMASGEAHSQVSADKREQRGSGARGDKTRTLRFRNDQVIDHRNLKRMTVRAFMLGGMYKLW